MIKIFMRRAWLTLLTPLALAALTPGGTRAVAGPFVPWVQYRYNSPSILGQDTSGNHHDAAVTTTQIGTGPYGLSDALIVQGNNGLIVPGDQFVGNAGITVDTWVQVSESRDQAVFYKDGQYLLRLDASGAGANLNFYIMLDGAWHQLSGPPISALSWHHIVASWDGSKALLWIDAQVSSAALPGKLTANSSNLMTSRKAGSYCRLCAGDE